MKIGIIGFGNFGKFMASHLKNKSYIIVTDIIDKKEEAEQIGVEFGSLEEVLKQKIIILSVEMENLRDTLHSIKDKISPGTLVLDVCSLKLFSSKLMEDLLPKNIEIIGTHPLFGPQSAKDLIEGMKIAICNIRSNKIDDVKIFCESLGLDVIICSPEEHDRQMAVSQSLTHFIGHVAKNIDLCRVDLSTKTFDDLMNVIEIMKNDTPALFENMQTMNPFAKNMRSIFVDETIKLNKRLSHLST
ncbi:hypothetical protein COU57_06630 [Candidatus Pacearchaeota archaeon CG10_big_fil_rev_8_21_14_0_10_32_14]|nr:MAG: hypothetical protein COU57_06630 [Candidatus Pacearchaeota archaeon CG10_big_fil_rev_8_21_14_0_10_32_14]